MGKRLSWHDIQKKDRPYKHQALGTGESIFAEACIFSGELDRVLAQGLDKRQVIFYHHLPATVPPSAKKRVVKDAESNARRVSFVSIFHLQSPTQFEVELWDAILGANPVFILTSFPAKFDFREYSNVWLYTPAELVGMLDDVAAAVVASR